MTTSFSPFNAKEIAQKLAGRAEDVAKYLLPQGKRHGREWKVGSIHGEPGNSLSVRIAGDAGKVGLWADFADRSGEGDLLDLWMMTRGVPLTTALEEAKAFLGIVDIKVGGKKFKQEMTYRRPEPIKVEAPSASRVIEWLKSRGITEETARAFRISEKVDGKKVFIVFPYYRDGELINAKFRNIADKKEQRQSPGAESCLLGWDLLPADARRIIICEGEPDAMVFHQMGFPALSVNQGAKNHQWLDSDWERLQRFSEIILAYDDDEAGRAGRDQVLERLGRDRCKVIQFPDAKDANDYLMNGASREDFARVIAAARSIDPNELKSIGDFRERTIDLFYPKVFDEPPLKIGAETYDWLRFRPGEVTVWTGRNGHGKSAFLSQSLVTIMSGCTINRYDGSGGQVDVAGQRVCVFSGELPGHRQAKRLVHQIGGVKYPSEGYINHIIDWLDDKMWVFDMVGAANVDRLLEVFTYAYRRYGMKQFVIDSLMTTDVPVDGPKALSAQKEFMQKLSEFAKRVQGHLHLVAHPKKSEHDWNTAGKSDVGGSGDLTNLAENVVSVWANLRDIESEDYDPDERDGKVTLLKQRNGDVQLRTIPIYFNPAINQYSTHHSRKPIEFLESPSLINHPYRGAPEEANFHGHVPARQPEPPPVDDIPERWRAPVTESSVAALSSARSQEPTDQFQVMSSLRPPVSVNTPPPWMNQPPPRGSPVVSEDDPFDPDDQGGYKSDDTPF